MRTIHRFSAAQPQPCGHEVSTTAR